MHVHTARAASTFALALTLGACGGSGQQEADLHARLSVLEREVDGLRDAASGLEGGGAALPEEDVIVALEESIVKDLLEAQLPFGTEVHDYHIWLEQTEVMSSGWGPTWTCSSAVRPETQPLFLALVVRLPN